MYATHHGSVELGKSSWWHSFSCIAGTLQPVPVPGFADHVNHMHANDDYLFSEEYSVSIRIRTFYSYVMKTSKFFNPN